MILAHAGVGMAFVLTIPRNTKTLRNYVWPLGENTKQAPELEPCPLYPHFQNVVFSPTHPPTRPSTHPSIHLSILRSGPHSSSIPPFLSPSRGSLVPIVSHDWDLNQCSSLFSRCPDWESKTKPKTNPRPPPKKQKKPQTKQKILFHPLDFSWKM